MVRSLVIKVKTKAIMKIMFAQYFEFFSQLHRQAEQKKKKNELNKFERIDIF